MSQIIILGISSGLGLAFMIGPAFFALLQTSISRGFRSAMQLAVGIFLSDAVLVALLLFFGAAALFDKPMVQQTIGLIGGGILIGIGVHTFLNRGKGLGVEIVETETEKEAEQIEKLTLLQKMPKSLIFSVKGFLLNLANPGTWLFWLLYVGAIKSQYSDNFSLIVFSLSTLVTVLGTDLLKAYGAHQLKNRITDNIIAKINIFFGLLLSGFGVFLIAQSIYPFVQI